MFHISIGVSFDVQELMQAMEPYREMRRYGIIIITILITFLSVVLAHAAFAYER